MTEDIQRLYAELSDEEKRRIRGETPCTIWVSTPWWLRLIYRFLMVYGLWLVLLPRIVRERHEDALHGLLHGLMLRHTRFETEQGCSPGCRHGSHDTRVML